MSRIIALILSILMLFGSTVTLISCSTEPTPPTSDDGGESDTPSEDNKVPENDSDEHIKVPEYKDHERGTINFSEIAYIRPNTDVIIKKFNTVTDIILKNSDNTPYSLQLEEVMKLEEDYLNLQTMYTYSNIKMSEDTSDKYWCDEYEYIAVNYPTFSKAVEELFVAAANSPYAEDFEKDYFGENLIEDYKDGGRYTDKLISLLEEEAMLESEYSSFSTRSTVITYQEMTDTVDSILKYYGNTFGFESQKYIQAKSDCYNLYDAAVAERTGEIFLSLLKVRSLISQEYGFESYSAVAYKNYHDYSEAEAIKFIRDIAKYIIPVYNKLNSFVFYPFFYSYTPSSALSPNKTVNTLASLYKNYDEDIYSVYSYMLQHNLYSCDVEKENRFEGSFATYLDTYNAPFLFTTFREDLNDFMTMSHEFGHFLDSYVNYGSNSSLDLLEVSSTAFEFLTMHELREVLTEEESKYLSYAQLDSAMQVLIFQGFYALFEHYAYEIPYESISEESLIAAMQSAAADMGFDLDSSVSLDLVMIPHIILYPFYVQSYCTSTAVALQIYFAEKNNEGDGIYAYKTLICRDDEQDFIEHLERAGIPSPFGSNALKALADSIHYEILGSHYYTEGGNLENAA